MSCLVHRARYDYMLLTISLVCIIIFSVSLCRNHLSLNNNKVYALPIVGLHAIPNSRRILTAGLQAYISRRSIYLHIV